MTSGRATAGRSRPAHPLPRGGRPRAPLSLSPARDTYVKNALARCDAVVTDVAAGRMSDQAVHDTYVSLQRVERDFRQMKTGLLEVRPIFVRKDRRTRSTGNVFADLGYPDTPERQAKLRLAYVLNQAIDQRALTQMTAVTRLGLAQPKVSALRNYKFGGGSGRQDDRKHKRGLRSRG